MSLKQNKNLNGNRRISKHAQQAANNKVVGAYAPKQAKLRVGDWEKMVTNPWGSRCVRTPSQSPFTGAARMFTRTLTVNSSGPKSRFAVTARPDLQNTLSIQRSDPIVLPDGGHMDSKKVGPSSTIFSTGLGQDASVMVGELQILTIQGNRLGELETEYDDTVDLCFWPISIVANESWDFSLVGQGLTTYVYVRALSTGEWQHHASHSLKTGFANITGTSATVAIDGIAVTVLSPGDQPYSLNFGGFQEPPVLGNAACYDFFTTDATTLSQVASYRVTALSVLATFTGNQFNDGGVISAARTRSGYFYPGLPYESLTRLTDHRYYGKAKDGAYAWWLPYSLDELNFRRPFTSRDETELRVAGIFDDADGQLQLTISMVVEFYSPLQIFEHKPGPSLNDSFQMAYHAMDTFPAATCNPAHTKILKGILGKAADGARGAAKLMLAHPELLASLMAVG